MAPASRCRVPLRELDRDVRRRARPTSTYFTVEATPATLGRPTSGCRWRPRARSTTCSEPGVSPGSDLATLILDPGSFAGIPGQDTVFVGLVKDELNYATAALPPLHQASGLGPAHRRPADHRGQEPHARLDGTTDLSRADPGSHWCCAAAAATAYVDQGSGWEFLFAYDTAEVLDIRDPLVRAQWRYGFGVRLDSGTLTVDGLEARRAR